MNVSIPDFPSLTIDPKMPFLPGALDPLQVQQQFAQHLPSPFNEARLCAIRVVRHKLGRRCLIEYDLAVESAAHSPSGSPIVTLMGKARAKGTDTKSYQLQQALWSAGFAADSEDGISVPEPIAVIPAFQMWLQRKVPGAIATQLLPTSQGIPLAQRIAQAAHKLHNAGIAAHRCHTLADELEILRDRFSQIMPHYPQWQTRLQRILEACDRLSDAMPKITPKGIHRDFYPDQIMVDGDRLSLLDLDLYCTGDPGLDIGNFIGHLIEQSIRTIGSANGMCDRAIALEEEFVRLSGEAVRESVQTYATLTLVRHIYLSTQFPERCRFTESLLELCEQKLGCTNSVIIGSVINIIPKMSGDDEFYDNPEVRANYLAHRAQPDNPNDTLERPLFLKLVGNLSNLDVVDLGCGDATFGKEALLQGARSYTGIEVSKAMVDLARQMLAGTVGTVYHQRIETWQAQDAQADLVTSRLALNYVNQLEPVFREIYAVLRPGGRVIISVEHPVITSNFASLAAGRRTTWLVDNYFKPGARVHTWLGHEITKYHHTLEEWLNFIIDADFQLECVRESRPQRANFLSEEEYERRLRIPLFLFISARKPK